MGDNRMKCFAVLAAVYDQMGGISALRVAWFDLGKVVFGSCEYGFNNTFRYKVQDDSPLFYNGLTETGFLPEPFTAEIEDIPIDKLGERLGTDNVAYPDAFGNDSSFSSCLIVVECMETAGIRTGKVIVSYCRALGHIRADGSMTDNVYQTIGTRGVFPQKKRSRKYIRRYAPNEKVYLIYADGKIAESTTEAEEQRLMDYVKYYMSLNRVSDVRDKDKVLCGTMLAENCMLPTEMDSTIVSAAEKYKVKYTDTMLVMKLVGMDGLSRCGDDPMFDYCFSSLPDDCQFMLIDEGFPSVNIKIPASTGTQTCRNIFIKNRAVETVVIESDRYNFSPLQMQPYYIGNCMFSYIYRSPYNYQSDESTLFFPANPKDTSLDKVLLPEVAAAGFVLCVSSVKELTFPSVVLEKFPSHTFQTASLSHLSVRRACELSERNYVLRCFFSVLAAVENCRYSEHLKSEIYLDFLLAVAV